MISRVIRKMRQRVVPAPPSLALQEWPDVRSVAAQRGWAVRNVHDGRKELWTPPSKTSCEQFSDMVFDPGKLALVSRTEWDRIRFTWLYTGEPYRTSDAFIVEIPDAYVQTRTGAVFLEPDVLVKESCITRDTPYDPVSPCDFSRAPEIQGPCVNLITLWGRNYAHWLFDSLPRLSLQEPAAALEVLVHSDPSSFQLQSLELLGIDRSRVRSFAEPLVKVRKLLLAVVSDRAGVPNAGAMLGLRRSLLRAAPAAPGPGRRLYVARSGSSRRSQRRIVNEAQVEGILQKSGFECIRPETLSFEEQVRTFSGAAVIAGAHGAGMYNLIFAPENITVIEFFNPCYWDYSSVRMSGLVHQRHWHLFGRNADEADNFFVDAGRLELIIGAALGERAGC